MKKELRIETILKKYAVEIDLLRQWFYDIGIGDDDFECYKNAAAVAAGRMELSEQLIENGLASDYRHFQLSAMAAAKFQNYTPQE